MTPRHKIKPERFMRNDATLLPFQSLRWTKENKTFREMSRQMRRTLEELSVQHHGGLSSLNVCRSVVWESHSRGAFQYTIKHTLSGSVRGFYHVRRLGWLRSTCSNNVKAFVDVFNARTLTAVMDHSSVTGSSNVHLQSFNYRGVASVDWV